MVNESYVSEVATLIERLEALAAQARHLPWTGKILVDEHELTTLLAQLQHAMPEEIRHAHYILSERSRIIDEAKEEAEQMKASGLATREQLSDSSAVAQASRQRAAEIVEQAQGLAKEIHRGSRQYADEMLASLETQLSALLSSVQKDRADLHD